MTAFRVRLNSAWHERTLQLFTGIVLLHWAEHLTQAYQVYVLHWPMHHALGFLGLAFPWLVHSEVLHYAYAVIMLVGIWALLPGFVGKSRAWWMAALVIQFWHHIEHALLQLQVILGTPFFGRSVPTSIAQLWFPRLELHLFYNTIVFIPMVVAMVYHLVPAPHERAAMRCSCALQPRAAAA